MNLGELHAEEARVLEEGLLMVRGQSPQRFLDEEELVKLVLSWEHRVAVDEFSHYAPHCPDIDLLRVRRSHQQLGWAVPPCRHVVSHLFIIGFLDLPSEAEVADLEFFLVADEQVLGLDVPMH